MWDVAQRRQLFDVKGLPTLCSSVAFSPDNRSLVSCDGGRVVKVWDSSLGKHLTDIQIGADTVMVGFSPSENKLVVDTTKGVEVFHAENWTSLYTVDLPSAPLLNMAFSLDGRLAAQASSNQQALLYEIATEQSHWFEAHDGKVTAAAFSPDSQILATAGDDKTIKLWSVSALQKDN